MKTTIVITQQGTNLVLDEDGQRHVINLAAEKLAEKLAAEEVKHKVYTIPQLAKRLECCRTTVDYLIDTGKLKLAPNLGKSKGYRVTEIEVRKFLNIAA